jgi:hypothetical protein
MYFDGYANPFKVGLIFDPGVNSMRQAPGPGIQGLACGTDITVAVGLARETFGAVERAVLSVDTVPGSHIRRFANHDKNSPFP